MIYGDNPGKNHVPNMSAILQSSNLYTYCRNNPLLCIDPSGLNDIEQIIYEENCKYEKWGFVYGQGMWPTEYMQYGTHYVDYNGCELIAIYNALFQLGDRQPLAHIIYDARNTDEISWGPGAVFGSHPDKLGILLDLYGHSYTSTQNKDEFNGMLKSGGTYILSFWNKGINGIHTVMFNMVSDDRIDVYNYENGATEAKIFYSSDGQSALDTYMEENGKPIILYKVE